jgi:Flp pilus assembly protein TadG
MSASIVLMPRMAPRPGHKAHEGGQAMVEFALVAPIFFLLLFGVIELGLLYAGLNGVVSAVRETARYSAPYRVSDASGADDTCTFYVLPKLQDALSQSVIAYDPSVGVNHMVVTYSSKQDPNLEWYIQVSVKETYDFPLWVPLIGNILDGIDGAVDGKLSLSSQEEMRVENGIFTTDPFAGSSPTPCTYG